MAAAVAPPVAANPADPYITKYGRQICDALSREPSHDEAVRVIATVRDYVHLSDEDATLVVTGSVSRLCPQYLDLIYRTD